MISDRQQRRQHENEKYKDEIAFEDWLKSMLKADMRSSFSVSVRRLRTDDQRFTAEDQINERKIEKAVEEFIRGKDIPEALNLKELNFILKSGLNRDIARNIDFQMRQKLEQVFPALKKFNVLCFKRKGYSTLRKAHVYQSEDGYKDFMDKLQKLMQSQTGKYVEELKSRVKFSFTGKFVMQIEEGTYKNFMDPIQEKIRECGLSHSVKQLIKRREISLFGNHEKKETMRKCVQEIMSMLHSITVKLDPELLKYDNYAMKSEAGEAERGKFNNKLTGKATCIYNQYTNELILKGSEVHRDDMKKRIESWARNFLNRVKTEKYEIKSKKRYFEKAAMIKSSARNRIDAHTFFDRSQEPPVLMIYYYDQKDDDRSVTPAIRKQQIQELKKHFDTILGDSFSQTESEQATIHPDDRCQLCNLGMDQRFRLICKHIYCTVCIRQHILETSNEDGCFCPVCKDQIYLIDLTMILPPDDLKPLFLKQKDAFLAKNTGRYKNCPTPDCGNILCNPEDTNSELSGLLQTTQSNSAFCDNCGQDYCFVCLKSHLDEDCSQLLTAKQIAKQQAKAQKDTIFQRDSDSESRDRSSLSFAKLLEDVSDSRAPQQKYAPPPTAAEVSYSREVVAPPPKQVHVCPGCRYRCTEAATVTYSLICSNCKTTFCTMCSHNFGKQAEKKQVYQHAVQKHDVYKSVQPNRSPSPPGNSDGEGFFE